MEYAALNGNSLVSSQIYKHHKSQIKKEKGNIWEYQVGNVANFVYFKKTRINNMSILAEKT